MCESSATSNLIRRSGTISPAFQTQVSPVFASCHFFYFLRFLILLWLVEFNPTVSRREVALRSPRQKAKCQTSEQRRGPRCQRSYPPRDANPLQAPSWRGRQTRPRWSSRSSPAGQEPIRIQPFLHLRIPGLPTREAGSDDGEKPSSSASSSPCWSLWRLWWASWCLRHRRICEPLARFPFSHRPYPK